MNLKKNIFVALFGVIAASGTPGVKSQSVGGAGIAFPQNGLAAAANPAGTGLVDTQINFDMSVFTGRRGVEIVGNSVPGVNGHYDGSGKKYLFIPDFGYVTKLSDSTSFGFASYGGGSDTEYNNNPFKAFGGSGRAKLSLEQVYLKPSFAYKLNEQHTFGVGINFVLQRLDVEGLQGFTSYSAYPDNMTNKEHSMSMGAGIHLGWIGQLTKDLTLGATWSSKVLMSRFDEYKGFFNDGGRLNIPETYGIGVAFKTTPALTLTADLQRIKYGSVDAVAHPLSNLFAGNLLGSRNGPGFGWRDVNVIKVGAIYEVSPELTLRAGYNHTDQQTPSDQTLFNVMAPVVSQDYLSLGGTWKSSPKEEWSAYYLHAFRKQLDGVNSIPTILGGGNANIYMEANMFGIGYTRKW
jgi:long-chain fatty acid transport protein